MILHKLEENTDWKSKYQDVVEDLEIRGREWEKIETLLRKTIGRLSIAGRGLDSRLDKQLRIIIFDNLGTDSKTARILFRLFDMLELEESCAGRLRQWLDEIEECQQAELKALADLLNEQLGTPGKTLLSTR